MNLVSSGHSIWSYLLLSCGAVSLNHFSLGNQPGGRKFCSSSLSLISDAHTFVRIPHAGFPSGGLLPLSAAALPKLACACQLKVWLKCGSWFSGTAREPVTVTGSQVTLPVSLVPGPHCEQRESV